MGSPAVREIAIRNDLADLDGLFEATHAFCLEHKIDDEAYQDLRLALDEAVSNTIRHGYRDRKPHKIVIRLGRKPRSVVLEIEDDARAYNPLEAPEPDLDAPIEERTLGGMGVHLLRQIMHRLEYRRVGKRNLLRMTRRLVQ